MRVLSVVGARPQFVKLAAVADAFAETPHEHVIVHTGQHYDQGLSDVFFADLRIPEPDVHLGVGSGSHGVQTGGILSALDAVLDQHVPDWVLVYGDTNSTLAGAISAVKMHLKTAHLEAGLRSFNRRMPEEHNRVLTDHAADLCLAPTEVAMGHLASEGLAGRSILVGDVMADVCLRVAAQVRGEPPPTSIPTEAVGSRNGFFLATVHRAENTDDPARLRSIMAALSRLPAPVVLPVHPRLAARTSAAGIDIAAGSLQPTPPLAYPDLLWAAMTSRRVLTDSGGLQKEAMLLRRECVTLRTETEWQETVQLGWNVLVPDPAGLEAAALDERPEPVDGFPYGRGQAAKATVRALEAYHPGD